MSRKLASLSLAMLILAGAMSLKAAVTAGSHGNEAAARNTPAPFPRPPVPY